MRPTEVEYEGPSRARPGPQSPNWNETAHSLFKGGLWLGAVMQPIERAFLLMAVIGVAGFIATVVYMTR
jgi:hypothetical protein